MSSPSSQLGLIERSPRGAVLRVTGSDRYAVSAALSAQEFERADRVFVASGEAFPDALSAAAAAGRHGAPVLLVGSDRVPESVAAELRRLAPAVIVLVGGLAAIGSAVEDELAGFGAEVRRVDGADRYEVSARLSAGAEWAERPVVWLASGEGFADALCGAAAAGPGGGPMLLVQKHGVPRSIADELARLHPSELVLLGGENAVTASTFDQLRAIVPRVIRVDGPDRYEVSAAASARAFPEGASTVFVASGSNFPDASSGAAAARRAGGPVILVTPDRIPPVIGTELARLRPTRIVVLGGTHTVSDEVVSRLHCYLAP